MDHGTRDALIKDSILCLSFPGNINNEYLYVHKYTMYNAVHKNTTI